MSKEQVATHETNKENNPLKALKDDVGRLNKIADGLGDRVVAFVNDGTGSSVLLELKALGRNHVEALDKPTGRIARKQALFNCAERGPEFVHRYGQVLQVLFEVTNWYVYTYLVDANKAPTWLLALMAALNEHYGDKISDPKLRRFFSTESLENLLTSVGEPRESMLQFLYAQGHWATSNIYAVIEGYADYLRANVDFVVNAMPSLHADGRKRLLEQVAQYDLSDAGYFDMVFAAAVGSSKGVRQTARPILQKMSIERILAKAGGMLKTSRSANERIETVELLVQLVGEPARDLLTAHMEIDKSKPVCGAITSALARIAAAPTEIEGEADGRSGMPALDGSFIEIPPMPELPEDTPLPAEALEPLIALIPAYNAAVEKDNQETIARHKENGWKWSPTLGKPINLQGAVQFLQWLNGKVSHSTPIGRMTKKWAIDKVEGLGAVWEVIFSRPEFTLWHLMRLVNDSIGYLLLHNALSHDDTPERALRAKLEQGLDFRVAAKMQVLVEKQKGLTRRTLQSSWETSYRDCNIPSLAYCFYDDIELIEEALGARPKSGNEELSERAALELLEWLPQVPARLLRPLLEIALSGTKQSAAQARKLLGKAPGIDEAIIARLSDPKKAVRASTAAWIAVRGMKDTIPTLKDLLKKEKAEEVRAAVLTALTRLGADISEYFSEKALKSEAEKGLAKGIGKAMEWFPFEAIPALKWADDRNVDPIVVKWWIVLAEKLKDPAGNPLFELYLDRLKPEDAQKFSLFLLQAFIERDTTTCSEAEALEYAKQCADDSQKSWEDWHKRKPEYANKYPFVYEKSFAQAKAEKLRQHIHSCSENRGFLGLTMRAPGANAGAMVRRYLKDHGNKVAQSKALLTALARNPAPSAIQVVLAVANRHKQKTVQALAKEFITAIADARGWTPDELADRTIPSAGFDETGILELPCGEDRIFRAVYRGEGKIDLQNPDGKVVKALPAARGDADKEDAAASKKALSDARKEVKQVESMQSQRLYEAMCVGRTWERDIWASCLQRHPIAGRLCQRLIWLGLDGEGKTLVSFRPLEDASLTNNADDTVELEGVTAIKLAHQAILSADESEAWATHLSDYEVVPLFPQFGRTVLAADGELKDATQIIDRRGWMLDSFKLQSVVTKLGYDKGEVGDGGGFSEYVKRFEGAGLRAVIEFTGSYMGAESFPCGLRALSFEPIPSPNHRYGSLKPLKLLEVPPVLLSEAWGDFHAIAAAGTGFDPEWEKKGLY